MGAEQIVASRIAHLCAFCIIAAAYLPPHSFFFLNAFSNSPHQWQKARRGASAAA